MSPIDPFNPVLAQIRAQALAFRKRASPGGATSADPRSPGAAEGETDWLGQVAQSVSAISADDPQRRRKAFRIYLQAVLARECGIRGVDEPGFQELVDRVLESMETDARLKNAVGDAGDLLLRTGGGG
jgi:hypothetical protein